MKTGMKLFPCWRIFMLVILDVIIRQDLIKNISIDKALWGSRKVMIPVLTLEYAVWARVSCSNLLASLQALVPVLLVRYPAKRVWWKLESRYICFIWVLLSRPEILFPLLKQVFQYNSVPPASPMWAAFNQTKTHNFHCVIHIHSP